MAHKIYMFVPAYGNMITSATFMTSHQISAAFNAKGIGLGVSAMSFPDIAELRAMATTVWYDTMPDSTHMLFVDNDMGFTADTVLDMVLFDEPVVGAIYRQRREPVSWAGSGTGNPVTERRGNFMEVEGTGMGCCLIRRDVITIMLEKMPELVDERLHLHPAGDTIRSAGAKRLIRAFEKMDVPERGLVSEDLSFCIRWRQCGGRVWASIGHKFSHVGPYDYAGRYLDSVEQQQKMQPLPFVPLPVFDPAAMEPLPVAGVTTLLPEDMEFLQSLQAAE